MEKEVREKDKKVRKVGEKYRMRREKKLTNRYYKLTKNEKNRAVAERKCQMSWSSKKSSRIHSRFFSRDSAGVPWRKVRQAVGEHSYNSTVWGPSVPKATKMLLDARLKKFASKITSGHTKTCTHCSRWQHS